MQTIAARKVFRSSNRFKTLACLLATCAAVTTLPGCGGLPTALEVPAIDTDLVASELISQHDKNGDGVLSDNEVKGPGFALRHSLMQIDKDGDRSLSASEIRDYAQSAWVDSGGAVVSARCSVKYKNKTVRGATVTLEPVDYLSDVIKPATGLIRGGSARLDMSDEDRPHENAHGVNCGLYVVRISKNDNGAEQIPAKYNTESILACEIAPRAGYMPGPLVFELK